MPMPLAIAAAPLKTSEILAIGSNFRVAQIGALGRGPDPQGMGLFLAGEAVIARHMLNQQTRHHALAVFDEFDRQAGEAGKAGFRARILPLLAPSIKIAVERAVRKSDLDNSRDDSPYRRLLHIGACVFRQNLGRDLYLRLRVVGSLADPVI